MSELEPTRTCSNPTANDILRRMLDERGVEWRGGLPTETIVTDPIDVLYVQRTDGMIHVYIRSYLTPEQAIAATLGATDARPTQAESSGTYAPTVEDVLRDVVKLCHNTWKEGSAFEFYDVDDVMKSGNIAEYAAKLRLAEREDA